MNYIAYYLNLIILFSLLLLGSFVFLKKRDKPSLFFLLFSFFCSLWAFGIVIYTIPWIISGTVGLRIAFMGASFLTASLIYFVQIFPKENYLPKWANYLLIGSLILVGSASIFSDMVVKEVTYEEGVLTGKEYGPLHPIYAFLVFFSLAVSMVFSALKYKKVEGTIKIQSQYVLIGMFVSFISGIITNLLLPILKIGPIYISQYGPICLYFFAILSALAITRYHLFDIKLILTEFLVALVEIPLFILPFLMPDLKLKIMTIFVLIFSLFVGFLLVKNTYREVQAKEVLEQKVRERTGELQESKDELEKFYKLTIGRELRMAELKDKIKEMEDKK